MSDRENDPQNQAIDPPENTGPGNMSLDSPEQEQSAEAIDPPENTKTKTRE